MANTAGAASFSAASGLKSSAAFGAIGLSLSGMYAITGVGIPCPWRSLTNTLCPFCGSTTMGVALLHGDVAGAWVANPFVFTLLAGLGLACLCWLAEVLGGPAIRLPRFLGDQRLWYAALTVTAVTFAVWRNLVPSA
ncbi:MAG TPA: DUF2752 domain-containing protein [Propionicimonas sp.]|uniref:DUF2752 domain-containing protein n=1 Tax=Propionicimonas sp. TaxID=1955623 RepID=UPI002F407AC4